MRIMEIPKPLPPDEVERLWRDYFEQFKSDMPKADITPEAIQCMRDAFYHGALAVLIRNAPRDNKEIIQ